MTAATIVSGGPVQEPVQSLLSRYGEIVIAPADDEQTLIGLVADAIALIARGASQVTRAVIEEAPHLRVIGRTGVGVDRVDLEAASERHIPVVITPGANDLAVAEGTIAMLLALIKRLPLLTRAVRAGDWAARDREPPGDAAGSTLAVVGLGRIGCQVARLAHALGMSVIGCDPFVDRPPEGVPARLMSLDQALAHADAVSLHVPLTPSTRDLITAERLRGARPGLLLVNAGRGGVARLDELHAALEEGSLAGLALDVYDDEPPNVSHPIFSHADVLLTPHVLGLSVGSRRAIFAQMTEGMVAVLRGDHAENVANPEIYGPDTGVGDPTARSGCAH